ncbi:MAG: hypothetical protein LBQ34_04145 [Alphaproteobacteria bacterium]|jgi:hypothetical protein|nr:hypothetical protein [Alphaproteobacteria bacterium]
MLRKIIFILAILAIIVVSYFMFFASENKFDIIKIQQNLSKGNQALFKTDIDWHEQDNKLIGVMKVEILKSKITYVLDEHAIESIMLLDNSQTTRNNLPCLNIIHLLSRDEVKDLFETLSKQGDGQIPEEAKNIHINSKMFIDYFQIITKDGIEFHCKLYYVK